MFLRDNNKPINILTGMDYWLDNLMCNVPELVMCFHVNGIVQVNHCWLRAEGQCYYQLFDVSIFTPPFFLF